MNITNYYAIPGILKFLPIDEESIIKAVCDYYQIEERKLESKSRNRDYVTPRHIAMYLIKTQTDKKLLHIGQRFKRDHTTVIHAMNKINGFIDIKDSSTITALEKISNKLRIYDI